MRATSPNICETKNRRRNPLGLLGARSVRRKSETPRFVISEVRFCGVEVLLKECNEGNKQKGISNLGL